jgi:hypothetical protein
LQWARGYHYFNAFLPDEGPDGTWGYTVALGERGFVPVNHPVTNGEELTIVGNRFQFFTIGCTDSDDTMLVWLPDQKVALNNVLWPFPPNIYSPRGSLWRDPRAWRDATRVLRDLQPEVLIGQPTLTIKGKEKIFTHLNNYMDWSNHYPLPLRKEHQLGRRLARAMLRALAGRRETGHGAQRHRDPPGLARHVPGGRRRGRRQGEAPERPQSQRQDVQGPPRWLQHDPLPER